MIKSIVTDANSQDLVGITERIDSACPLNRFNYEQHWSTDCVRADHVYRIDRFVQRVIEETGPIVQGQIIDLFEVTDKVFPYKIQLIKIDKNTFNTDIVVDGQICQTITQLKEECITYILPNNIGNVSISDLVFGEYAIASYWTNFKDPEYPRWFMSKYLRHYDTKKSINHDN
jgi:hypothetical protein